MAQAEELVEPNAFGAMLQRSGAVGLNATTSHDATKYFMSLPANMLELWFALEAERFQVRGPARMLSQCQRGFDLFFLNATRHQELHL